MDIPISDARSVAVLTGAGISAESGVPTFRGDGGLWRNYRAEDLATPHAFRRDPGLVWEWYDVRRALISKCQPNEAHRTLAEMENHFDDFTIITQNVDGLHDLAGSQNLVKLHGDLWEVRCAGSCGWRETNRGELEPVPSCPRCGSLARPGVVWFGEALPEEALAAVAAGLERFDFFLVAGTSGVVQPAASLAVAARQRGAFVVEVNLEPTPLTETAHLAFHGPAGQILPELI